MAAVPWVTMSALSCSPFLRASSIMACTCWWASLILRSKLARSACASALAFLALSSSPRMCFSRFSSPSIIGPQAYLRSTKNKTRKTTIVQRPRSSQPLKMLDSSSCSACSVASLIGAVPGGLAAPPASWCPCVHAAPANSASSITPSPSSSQPRCMTTSPCTAERDTPSSAPRGADKGRPCRRGEPRFARTLPACAIVYKHADQQGEEGRPFEEGGDDNHGRLDVTPDLRLPRHAVQGRRADTAKAPT